MIEPSQEPIPGSPSKATRNEETHFLSPVSKLEIAKQLAAKEQQKRVDSVCSRLVEAKKVENLNRLHLGRKGTHVYLSRDESVKYGVFSTIKSKVVHAFNFVHNFTTSISNESDTTIHAPTRELLRAAREKLRSESDDGCPATNFQLKQLGLVSEKINIYAPIHEQHLGLRQRHRRQSALRCQQSFSELREHENVDEDSAGDSDYEPDLDISDESESEFESDDLYVDKDEMRHLVRDQNTGVDHYLETLRKSTNKTFTFSSFFIIFVFIMIALLAVMLSEEHSGHCQRIVTVNSTDIEDARSLMCGVILQLHQALKFAHTT